MKHTRWLLAGFVAAGAWLASGNALAQSIDTSGFAIDRFDPSERGSDWFSVESLDLRGDQRLAVGLVADWAHKPLVVYDADGNEKEAIIKDQLFAHVGASFVMWDRVRFALNVPLAVYQDGSDGSVSNTSFSSSNSTSLGDPRIGADVRLLGKFGDAFTLAAGLQVHLPFGNQDAFASDGKVRIVPRLMAAGDVGGLVYGVRAGLNIRTRDENFAGEPFGTEMTFGAAVGARVLDKKLVIGPELYGSTVVSDSGDGAFKRKTTPFEVIFGGHYQLDDWKLGAGVGPGLTRGIGAPQVRVLASVEYAPGVAAKPSDRDKDGILDKDDACPDTAGIASEDPKLNGCPDRDKDGIFDKVDACPDVPGVKTEDPATNGCPADRDKDTILDKDDACPDVAGVKTDDPKTNGCPPPNDRDGDGIVDENDACPDVAGVKTDDPKTNGCPPPKDSDGDGINDDKDACPHKAGPADPDPKMNGCPKAKIVGKEIKIMQRVEFDTNKATIRPSSNGVLNAVLGIMKGHKEIKLLSVEGHTDNRGAVWYNVNLSKKRAASVVKWLVSHGVERNRLSSKGFGPKKPIDSNATEEGRQNNRRVEFHILKRTKNTTNEQVR